MNADDTPIHLSWFSDNGSAFGCETTVRASPRMRGAAFLAALSARSGRMNDAAASALVYGWSVSSLTPWEARSEWTCTGRRLGIHCDPAAACRGGPSMSEVVGGELAPCSPSITLV